MAPFVVSIIERMQPHLDFLEGEIGPPFNIIDENQIRGFRYAKPDVRHFVFISTIRCLSLINSMKILTASGFQSESMILSRSVTETISKVDYVIGGLSGGKIDKKSEHFLADFFSDAVRDVEKRKRHQPIPQKDINRRKSEKFERDKHILRLAGIDVRDSLENVDAGDFVSSLFNLQSNYVHGRYPEMMDLFGEFSARPKIFGDFESKDMEQASEIEFLDSITLNVEKTLKKALLLMHGSRHLVLPKETLEYCIDGLFE